MGRIFVISFIFMFGACSLLCAEIDMNAIAMIESSNNPLAYNANSGATGMYQITEICLVEYNSYNRTNLSMRDMFSKDACFVVANWYINERIPSMLNYYGIEDTEKTRLWAYNAGIGNVRKVNMPRETQLYIEKYLHLKNSV